ncbi:DMT family transporter [Aurantiacibacter xanthus]|uniref:DMT family transporter n=2 Tax=Aurantiacibacter xanthus TaxID=1784712 RepID=A0A3A1PCL5_9SPHN|nr:DMT family transporter [Aurantiacibacter xanthus]
MLALAMRLAGIMGFALMAALIKLASQRGIHLAEIMFWRQFVTLPLIAGWAVYAGGLHLLATKRPKAHLARSLYGIVGMLCNFGAVILLPLAEAQTINFSAPIFAVILSMVLLREQVGVWRWSAVLAGFVGILIIARPGDSDIALDGALVALGGAFMIALISIQIRDLGKTEKPYVIVFWFALTTVVLTAPFLPFTMKAHGWQDWLLLLGIGLSGTWGQLLITMALRYGKVASVIVMDYSAIVWATLLGWLMFANLPPATTFIGAPIVIAAGLVIAWRERVLSQRAFVDQRQATGT